MSDKIVLEKKILRASSNTLIIVFALLAIFALIGIVVVLIAGNAAAKSWIPIMGVALVIFAVIAIITFVKFRLTFQLIRTDSKEFIIIIEDPDERKEIKEPWEYFYRYETIQYQAGAPTTKALYLSFYKDNKCLLEFKEDLGALDSSPYGWTEDINPFVERSKWRKKYIHTSYRSYDLVADIVKTLERQKKLSGNS